MEEYNKQIYSIHFPGNKVYIDKTIYTLKDKFEMIKDDKDYLLYKMFKEYPNPEIKFECYNDLPDNLRLIHNKYERDFYEIINSRKYSLIQSIYKWLNYLKS